MNKTFRRGSLLSLALLAACSSSGDKKADSAKPSDKVLAAASAAAVDPCKAPTTMPPSAEEAAWKLFVAATCPVNANKYPYVAWENWMDQDQLYSNTNLDAVRPQEHPRFHASPLRTFMQKQVEAKKAGKAMVMMEGLPGVVGSSCGLAGNGSGRTICEETRINPEAQQFISQNGLTTRAGQLVFAKAGKAFEFPPAAIEIKADWVQLASCTNPPTNVHIEQVGSNCFALAGMHLISKLIDKWIWATFEPQNATTNPNRCVELGCTDTWGSAPTSTTGASTQLTKDLDDLMTAAKLASEWKNYRLDGVQVDFLNGTTATLLGNSIIEGENVGAPLKTSSCITCHDFSTIRTNGKAALSPDFKVGAPAPLPAGMLSRDFVWSLSLAK